MTQVEFLAQLLAPYDSKTINEAVELWHKNTSAKAQEIWAEHCRKIDARKAKEKNLGA